MMVSMRNVDLCREGNVPGIMTHAVLVSMCRCGLICREIYSFSNTRSIGREKESVGNNHV